MGDRAAKLLVEYATELARRGGADNVTLRAVGSDGDAVEVTFLIDTGSNLVIESATASGLEPDNSEAEAEMEARMDRLRNPPNVQPADAVPAFDDFL